MLITTYLCSFRPSTTYTKKTLKEAVQGSEKEREQDEQANKSSGNNAIYVQFGEKKKESVFINTTSEGSEDKEKWSDHNYNKGEIDISLGVHTNENVPDDAPGQDMNFKVSVGSKVVFERRLHAGESVEETVQFDMGKTGNARQVKIESHRVGSSKNYVNTAGGGTIKIKEK